MNLRRCLVVQRGGHGATPRTHHQEWTSYQENDRVGCFVDGLSIHVQTLEVPQVLSQSPHLLWISSFVVFEPGTMRLTQAFWLHELGISFLGNGLTHGHVAFRACHIPRLSSVFRSTGHSPIILQSRQLNVHVRCCSTDNCQTRNQFCYAKAGSLFA